ncbi:MAG TPA: hypothetical protein VNA04_12560 [Thermoanaerobaculia bacterium]|nr:hypothetical protein [Thermoanaerobaculia bacterium]
MSAARRPDRLAVALLVLLPTLFFADVLLGFGNFAMRDLSHFYYPTKQIYRQIVAGGEFPLWNRYSHAGQPLAANPEHEIFYPFTWLTLLPSYDLGYRLHILVHLYIGLLAMYALLRSLRIRPEAAFFGAVSWGLGGLYLSYVNLLPIFFCAAWLPLTCLYARRFLLHRRPADFALAALFFGVQCLVAEPTTIVQTGLIIGMYGLVRGWRAGAGRMLANTGWIGLITAAGFAAGAVQMLAAIDLAGDSARARPFPFPLVQTWSMPWAKLSELVYPNILGHIGIDVPYWGGAIYEPPSRPFLFSIYPGLAVTALVVAALAVRARGSRFVLLLFAFSTLLAAGSHTPLLRWLYDAGIAASVRYPEKFILIGVFAITVFAARLLDEVLRGDERIRRMAAAFALATAAVAAVVTMLRFLPRSVDVWLGVFGLPAEPLALELAATAWRDWSVAAGRGLVLFLLLIGLRRVRRPLWLTLGFLFLCADLGPVVHELNPRLESRFFTTASPAVRSLPPNRSEYRIFHEASWYTEREEARPYFSSDTMGLWFLRNGLFPPIQAAHAIQGVLERDYDRTALLPTVDLTAAMWRVQSSGRPEWWRPFMAMSNAWYRAVFLDFDEAMRRSGGDLTEVQPVELVPAAPSPRYYFADQIVPVSGPHDLAEKLTRGTSGDRVAFVEQPPAAPAEGTVVSVRERANSAIIDVVAAGPAFLVMSVTRHKYWRITIDGKPVRPFVTNIAYQGVVVPPGAHRVAMQYRNGLIEIGAVVSALAFTILLLMAAFGRRERIAGG